MKLLGRSIVVILIVLVLVIGGLAFYVNANLNDLIEQYKPDLERMASDAVGSTVTFGEITAQVFPQASMVVQEVRVVHEAHPDDALTLNNLSLQLQLMPLLRKDLVIETLALEDPNLTLILDQQGIFLAGLPRGGEDEPEPEEEEEGAIAERAREAMPVRVQLHNLALENVTLTLRDTIREETYTVQNLNIASGIQMDERTARLTDLDVVGTALTDIDFAFEGGSVLYSLSGGSIEVNDLTGTVLGNPVAVRGALDPQDSSKIMEFHEGATNLASLGPVYDAFAPGLHDLDLVGKVTAVVRMWLESGSSFNADATVELAGVGATVGEYPLTNLTGPITIGIRPEVQMAQAEKLSGEIREAPLELAFDFRAENQQAKMQPLQVRIFSGSSEFNATFRMDGSDSFVADAKAENMRIEEMIAALAPDLTLQLTGNVASVTGDVQGAVTDAMTETLNGDLSVLFVDGVLGEVNVAKEALGKITEFPFIQGALIEYVPERFHEAFMSDRTVLNEVRGTFDLANETMTTDDLFVESTYFTMESEGTIGLDSAVDLDCVIYFSKEFSDALAVSVKELQYAYDDQGRFTFPMTVEGVPPDLAIRPDVSALLKGSVKRAIIGEGLDQLLGEDEEESTEQTGEESEEPESLEETGKKLLRGILDR